MDAGVRETAYTFLHEIGHNIGAEYVNLQATAFFLFLLYRRHDFIKKHQSRGCDGQGFMSYGKHKVGWSKCSISDIRCWIKEEEHRRGSGCKWIYK